MPLKKLLFITHDCYRTGAPILLLNLIRILKDTNSFEISIYVKDPAGPLLAEFQKLAPTFLPIERTFFDKVKNRLWKPRFNFLRHLPEFDFVISNTITNGRLYDEISKKGKPIITYVHELEIAVGTYTNPYDLEQVLNYTTIFAVPSLAVGSFLTKDLKVKSNKIFRLDYFIPSSGNDHKKTKSTNLIVVGASGTTDWRKGPDLFLAVAKEYILKFPDSEVIFKWKGATINSIEYKRFTYEIKKAGLIGKIEFLPADNKMREFYNEIDLFLLTSREDPYPLVVLEAASFQIPAISFDSNGGIPEFIENSKGGKLVPFLGVSDMALAISSYVKDRSSIQQDGEFACRKLKELHQDNNRIYAQLLNIIEKTPNGHKHLNL